MNDSQIHSVGRFFYLAFLDKSKAFKATLSVYQKIKTEEMNIINSELIAICYEVWKSYTKKKVKPVKEINALSRSWHIPNEVDLIPWQTLLQDKPEIYLTLILSSVLNYSDLEIAQGMGIAEGSVRFRLSKGFKIIGHNLSRGAHA